jgi:2-dehydropantoate 2-reductase
MQEIQKVAILGAGAMGAYFASRFFDTAGFSTVLIAKGHRLDKLKTKGLVVNEKSYAIPVIDPDEATSKMDLIIVALKHHHLEEAAQGLEKLVGDSTTIISVMNGLESEEYIGSIYGMDKMLYTISVAIDAVRQGNQITYTKPGKHYFGEAINTTNLSQRVLRVQEAFDRAGIVYETPEDMIRMMWWKFMINVGVNQASAVMRAPLGVFQKSPEAQGLMEALMKEVIALTDVIDINLTNRDIEEWYTFLNVLSPQGKTSMLQDIEAGRKTEVEIFGEKVVALGKIHGVTTPVNQTVLQIIRVLEQHSERNQNRGKQR